MQIEKQLEERSLFGRKERADLKAKEQELVAEAKRTGDGKELFQFWAEKKEMLLNRAAV